MNYLPFLDYVFTLFSSRELVKHDCNLTIAILLVYVHTVTIKDFIILSFHADNVSLIFNTNKKLKTNSIQHTRKTIKMAGGKAGKDSGKMKAKAVSRSAKSGLQFPVGRIHRHLKSRTTSHGRIGATAAVYRYEDGRHQVAS